MNSSGSPSASAAEVGGSGARRDEHQADEERRHRDDEPRDRSGDADVEQHALVRIGSRILMNAPSVPVRIGAGRKYGSDASTR